MPDKRTLQRAQAGEFIHEEVEHIREGKHGARSAQQAIAIGLSKARRAGVDLPPPEKGKAFEKTRGSAARAYARGHGASPRRKSSAKRSLATLQALRHEGHGAASHRTLARQSHPAAMRRTRTQRSISAKKAVFTRGLDSRSAAARKAARTRKS
jgi:hypothetical protein